MLQKLTLKKINDFCSYAELNQKLDFYLNLTPKEQKHILEDLIVYFNNLNSMTIDAEAYAMEFHRTFLQAQQFLKNINKIYNCKHLQFLIELIEFKLNLFQTLDRLLNQFYCLSYYLALPPYLSIFV